MKAIKQILSVKLIDLYILCWASFYIGRYFGMPGARGFLMFITVWSVIDMVLVHEKYKISNFIKIYDMLLTMFLIYGFFLLFGDSKAFLDGEIIDKKEYIFRVFRSLVPFYTFYRYTISGQLKMNRIIAWSVIFFLVALLDYQYMLNKALMLHFGSDMSGQTEEVTNSGSYVVLGLLPIICLMKKRIIQVVCICVCFYFILVAFKRGPILIFLICILYYLYYSNKIKKNKVWLYIAIFAALVYSIQLVESFMAASDLLQVKLEQTIEGDSSKRDWIVVNLLDKYSNSNIINLFFGYGAYGTLSLVGRLAHNDWVQILVDHGIFGIVIHMFFCWQLFKVWSNTEKNNNSKLSIGLFVIIYIMTTLFSMAFDRIPLFEMVILSFFTARVDLKTVLGDLYSSKMSNKTQLIR